MQIPGYLENQDALKAAGVDEVLVYCVNDGAVMQAWAKDQGVEDNKLITFMGDPSAKLTALFDMQLAHPGPQGVGLFNRCKRHAVLVVDGVVKNVAISEKVDDPAGDDFPESTCAPAMLEAIAALKSSNEL